MLRCECETLLLLPEENDSILLLRLTKRIWWWPKQYFNSTSTFVSSLKKAGSAWEKYTRIMPSPYLGPDKYIKCKRVYWIYFWGVLNQEWYISYREQDRLLSISFPKQRFRQVGENCGVSSKTTALANSFFSVLFIVLMQCNWKQTNLRGNCAR